MAQQVCDNRNKEARKNSKPPVKEGILCFVVSGTNWLLKADHVDDSSGGEDVKNLHKRVVQGIICGKKVKIPSHKNQQEQLMRTDRNP